MNFGVHLTLDGYGGNHGKLNDKALVLSFLNELPLKMEMKKLTNPEVYFAEGNNLKDPGGWSGFVVIEESHISIHTFPGRGFVSADVYTCKSELDEEFVKSYITNMFELKDLETNFIKRGTRYPSSDIIQA